MAPLTLLNEMFDYNYWARDRQLEACAAVAQEDFVRPVAGSFRSLRDTLAHLAAVEWLWLERWRGRSPRSLLPASEFPNVSALEARWRAVEAEMRAWLAGMEERQLAGELTYVNLKGEQWTYPFWRTVVHLINHQSYHRGQVTTLLRQLGAEAPMVDFLYAHDLGLRGR